MSESFGTLEVKILRWADERGIIKNSTALAQAIKTAEELAELLKALSKGDKEEAKDAIGDCAVTLLICSDILGVPFLECLDHAYSVIKDRKGYLSADGIFVKDLT